MEELTKAQKARLAIRVFKTLADALALRGYYKPSGRSGETLSEALKMLSPEIYGTMNDPRIIELKGLEYVLDRLPKGIESCTRIVLTAQDDMEGTSFEKIEPPKRRRLSYRVDDKTICFVITRGLSEIYDILTHITFLNIEAKKIKNVMTEGSGAKTREWRELEKTVQNRDRLSGPELDKAIWNLSIILGRTYFETRQTFEYLEEKRREYGSAGVCQVIYSLGRRMEQEAESRDNELLVYFTPSLRDMIGSHKYGQKWAAAIKKRLTDLSLHERPLHIVSANLHSVMNLLYAYAALGASEHIDAEGDIYELFHKVRDKEDQVQAFANQHGLHDIPDTSGAHIDCQLIDAARLDAVSLHPELNIRPENAPDKKPVILVMDYAFGTQAFEVLEELLAPFQHEGKPVGLDIASVSVMGKAGILTGKKGDIMLATAHVMEGTPHNYIVHNDLKASDFDGGIDVYAGPIVTVLGTSLQNRDVLEKFQTTSWRAVGLEMEGGHYHRAVNAAVIRGHIREDVKVRYAYYASDNPLVSGQTLASGGMGREGVRPTYMITRVILEKILNSDDRTGAPATGPADRPQSQKSVKLRF